MKYKIINQDGSIKSIHSDGESTIPAGAVLLTDDEYYAIANAPEPVHPPTPEELRAAIQSQIDSLEAKYHMARPVREFMLLSSVEKAAALGYTEPQLYAANIAYKAVKDFDAQITALRAEKDAII